MKLAAGAAGKIFIVERTLYRSRRKRMADSKTNKVKGIFNKVGHDAERIGRDIGQGAVRAGRKTEENVARAGRALKDKINRKSSKRDEQ